MYDFKYVTKKEASAEKNNIIALIHDVQDDVREEFTLSFFFVGSTKNNMNTQDPSTNIGFDFDVDLQINRPDEFKPKYLRKRIKKAIDKVAPKYGYGPAEDSTRVLTIKKKDVEESKIIHSADFAIVREEKKYVHFNKKDNLYMWE